MDKEKIFIKMEIFKNSLELTKKSIGNIISYMNSYEETIYSQLYKELCDIEEDIFYIVNKYDVTFKFKEKSLNYDAD